MEKLDKMIARLQSDVAAHDGVPSDTQYEDAVEDAVDDFNGLAPMTRVVTISIVAGTAEYALPADFVRLITFQSPVSPDGVISSAAGLIPLSATFDEIYTIAGLTITLSPTPTYTLARDMQYAAGHVLNDSDEYLYMTRAVAKAVNHKAQARALRLKANDAAQKAWQYTEGDERVNKEKLSAALLEQAEAAETEFKAAVAAAGSGGGAATGMRATYTSGEYGSFARDVD